MLWIITQDGKSIMNVQEVTVDGKKLIGIISSSAMDQWSNLFGKYDSKERALEILQAIFTSIEENNSMYTTFFCV